MIRFSRPVLSGDAEARLRELLVRGPGRATGARILNRESEKLREVCVEFSEQELHRRPDDRRTKESLAHGKEFHDSWRVVTAKENGYDLVAKVGNDHPAAVIIEKGAREHPIPASGPDNPLAFPFVPGQGPGGVGKLGNFPVAWSDAPTRWSDGVPMHPGTTPHRIGRRARDAYRKRAKRILNRG